VTQKDSISRFSSRADDYVRFRPEYPSTLLRLLETRCGLTASWRVADIGAGTGRLASVFLENGNRVVAIEPNSEMRSVATDLLGHHPNLEFLDAAAEATTLEDGSIDLAVAGSAFHWFDEAAALREQMRILRPSGWTVFVRMTRRVATPFERGFEDLLSRYSEDHAAQRRRRLRLERRLIDAGFIEWSRVEERAASLEDLLGLSVSYSVGPVRGQSEYSLFAAELEDHFHRHTRNGVARLGHDMRVHYCQLHAPGHGLDREALSTRYWDQQHNSSIAL
jgi:SAM-dependent methyltransferase